VISGVAVVLHGHVRSVADLDVVIDPAPDEVERALRALAGCGFVPSIPLPLSMLTVLRMFDRSQREVDVFVRYHIPFDRLWANSRHVRVRTTSRTSQHCSRSKCGHDRTPTHRS
jgi:hypothetical protein